MSDEEDVQKLTNFLKSNIFGGQNSLQQELNNYLNNELVENESTDSEDYNSEIELDIETNKIYHVNKNVQFTSNESPILSPDEEVVINNCPDEKLKKLMISNRALNSQLKLAYTEFARSLFDCQNIIHNKVIELKDQLKSKPKSSCIQLWKIGIPYFKDSAFYFPPANSDVKRKKDNNELQINQIQKARIWTEINKSILYDAVLLSYFQYLHKKYEQDLRIVNVRLEKSLDEEEKIKIAEEQQALKEKLQALIDNDNYEAPPLHTKEGIDWISISQEFRGRFKPTECEAFWNLYLHPSINKSNWSEKENKIIVRIARQHKYQNWEKIALQLATNRSGFSVCVHYYSQLCDKFKKDHFNPEEDQLLLDVIQVCRSGYYIPWAKVANYFPMRSKMQLYHRYVYYLSNEPSKKGPFTEAEDTLILYLVDKFGKNFTKISEYVPERNPIQIRNRHSSYLEPKEIKLRNFSLEDDNAVLDYVLKHGDKRWTNIARSLKRTRAHVRQRYLYLKKWISRNPQKDIKEIRRLNVPGSLSKIHKNDASITIIQKLKNSREVPTLQIVENLLNQEKRAELGLPRAKRVGRKIDLVDEQLVEYFKNSFKTLAQTKPQTEPSSKRSATTINAILTILNANLDIPNDADLKLKPELDTNDIEILSEIRKLNEKCALKPARIQYLVPPNRCTLLGLRGTIVKCNSFKQQINNRLVRNKILHENSQLFVPVSFDRSLEHLDQTTAEKVLRERTFFAQRLYSLFKWPDILSKIPPTENFSLIPKTNEIAKNTEPKKRGRKRKVVNVKIEKMRQAKLKLRKKDPDESVVVVSDANNEDHVTSDSDSDLMLDDLEVNNLDGIILDE